MRIAVLSDIHGNFEAFQAILADMDRLQPDDVACLGDCIGYGPEPEAVMQTIMERGIDTILGNHEMAALDSVHLNWFNPMAKRSLEITLTMLSEASLSFIQTLPFFRVAHGHRFVHGYPPDSAQTYLFQKTTFMLRQSFQVLEERLCFIGHTHDLEIVSFDGRQASRAPLHQGRLSLAADTRYMINVGSVGQPRDGTTHAKYIIWDDNTDVLEVRFVPYDITATVTKIRAAGMPEAHAKRLL
ncbi:MAG: metallophosphoesterase family protein [Desulfatitalea sp.]|nr:metallophosphatase family protein [Desulfatitalea sp.]NNK00756.1 metallophosphoesterase family protein [Desulfatitalea sp.]